MKIPTFRHGLTFLTILAVVLAGCAGKPASAPNETPQPTEPIVTDTTGSIAGLVVDEEVLPIGGAQLLIQETRQTATTAPDGRFAINALEPGTYSVFVSALGYQSASARMVVEAGAIAEKTFSLATVVLGVPYHESLPFAGRFECSTALVDVFWLECPGSSQVAPDSTSSIQFEKPEGVTHIVAELRWTQASAGTGQNLDFNLVEQGRDESQWYANVFGPSPLKIILKVGERFENPKSPGGGVGSDDHDQVVDDEDTLLQLDLYSSPVYLDELVQGAEREALVGLTIQQSFEGFVTLFYNEEPAEDFSAFPDA